MKKFILGIGVTALLIGNTIPAYAGEIVKNSSSFVTDWEKVTSAGDNATMKYGYNTSYIDEDYTHTYHTTSPHTAIVGNNKGYFNKAGKAKSWAKIEITHKGNYSVYKMTW